MWVVPHNFINDKVFYVFDKLEKLNRNHSTNVEIDEIALTLIKSKINLM